MTLPENMTIEQLQEELQNTEDPDRKARFEHMIKIKQLNKGAQSWQKMHK